MEHDCLGRPSLRLVSTNIMRDSSDGKEEGLATKKAFQDVGLGSIALLAIIFVRG